MFSSVGEVFDILNFNSFYDRYITVTSFLKYLYFNVLSVLIVEV